MIVSQFPTSLPVNYKLSSNMSPNNEVKMIELSQILYALVVRNLIFVMICTRPNIAQVVGVTSWFITNLRRKH